MFRRYENIILTALFLAVLGGFAALRYDYYYDLNDDVLMKDIVAGVYTGVPEGRNIQMLYPISALISFFYRCIPGLPWYGLFLCACQYVSLGLIVNRSLYFGRNTFLKGILVVGEGIIVVGTMLEHLIFLQYSITCTMLAAAAVFLFFTADKVPSKGKKVLLAEDGIPPTGNDNDRQAAGGKKPSGAESRLIFRSFLRKNILAILLVGLAFLIRSEMVLLVLPLICVAGLCKWGEENPIFTMLNAGKYFTLLGGILAGLLLGQGIHMVAYGGVEWQKFTEFFDNRTQLYDFQKLPEYEAHKDFYENIGLTEREVGLLDNYNFGLSEKIDEKVMGKIAAYAAERRREEKPFAKQFAEMTKEYYYKMTHGGRHGDFPWNALIIIGYVGMLGIGINQRKIGMTGGKLLLLFGVRSALWMYLLMAERNPPRIAHSLYFMEFCLLCAMLLTGFHQLKKDRAVGQLGKFFPVLVGVLMLTTAAINLPEMVRTVDGQTANRAEVNRPWQEFQAYARNHPENFYFIDVYSTVAYSEKIFAGVDNRPANYDYMGGWACKSPLYEKKLTTFLGTAASMAEVSSTQTAEIDKKITMSEALATRDNVYLVAAQGKDLNWLVAYYREQGKEITIHPVETIAGKMEVYKIND